MGKKKVAQQSGAETGVVAAPKAGKKTKRVESGTVYIRASYNNTMVSVTDQKGNVVAWASSGSLGFSGPRKATPFASSKIMAVIAEQLKAIGMTELSVVVKGVGSGRDSALRSLANFGFAITSIRDLTPIPHNGPRPPKVRRV